MWDELSGGGESPAVECSLKQGSLDDSACNAEFKTLLGESKQVERASMLGAAEPELDVWRQVILIPSLGALLNADTNSCSCFQDWSSGM